MEMDRILKQGNRDERCYEQATIGLRLPIIGTKKTVHSRSVCAAVVKL